MTQTIADVIEADEIEGQLAAVGMAVLDWSVLDIPGVQLVLDQCAGKVAAIYGDVTTADDLQQDGAVMLAKNAARVRGYMDDPEQSERYLHVWLSSRMKDSVRTLAAHARLNVPFHVIEEGHRAED